MGTDFPYFLDNFMNPTNGDTLDSPNHASQHADVNDAVEALQAKVGVDGSLVGTSLDNRFSSLEGNFVHPELVSVATVTNITGYGFGNDNPLRRYCSTSNTTLPDWQKHFFSFNNDKSPTRTTGTLKNLFYNAVTNNDTYIWKNGGSDGNLCWFDPNPVFTYDYPNAIDCYGSTATSSNYVASSDAATSYFVDPQPYTAITLSGSPSVTTDGIKIGGYYFKVNKTCMFDGNTLYLDGDYSSLIESGATVYTAQYSDEDKQRRSGIVMHFESNKWIDAKSYWEPIETSFTSTYPYNGTPLYSSFYNNRFSLGEHCVIIPDEWNEWYYELEIDFDVYSYVNVYNYIYVYFQPAVSPTLPNDHDYNWAYTFPALAGNNRDVYLKHSVFANGRETLGAKDNRSVSTADTANFPQTTSYTNFNFQINLQSWSAYGVSYARRAYTTAQNHESVTFTFDKDYYVNSGGPLTEQRFMVAAPFFAFQGTTSQRAIGGSAKLRAVRVS